GAVPPEQIAYWLQSAESGDFQLLLIEYITDRSLPMEQALIGVIQSGHDPMCRKAALRALVSLGLQTPEVIRVLLETLEKDTAPEVRETCIRYFHCLLQLTPDLQGVLLQYLQKATSQQVCLLILELLTPYLSQSPDLRTTFIEQLQVNLHTQVAAVLYEALGQIALRDPQLKEGLLEAYFKIQDDRLRGIILRTLTTGNEPTDRFAGLYREALQAPDLTLKTWGLRGLLQLPLIPENVDVIAAGADLLLNVDLDTALRQAVARKIGRIAVMPAILRQKLQKVGDQSDSEVLREICRAALNRVVDEKAISATDLDDWYYRVEREGNVDGIFPYIYSIYDDYPQRCFPILKLVLLSPSCGYSRYANRITDLQLLRFLMSRNAIDDDICRYCIGTILQLDESYGQLGIYLAVLRTRPGFPGLRESLWALFRRKTDVTKFNPVLLRQTLVTVYGGDDAAGQAFEEHLAQLNSRIRAEPYLHFLLKNLLWGPTRQLLRMVLERPELWDEQMRVDLQLALKEFGDVINVKLSKPGVCND
ncbi:MAG TPA: HEAT repeat domain-containing protein, partial [Bacillota bacterium]|nr:HEAT repeat domain-containing protein [Bacillota bacterium]